MESTLSGALNRMSIKKVAVLRQGVAVSHKHC